MSFERKFGIKNSIIMRTPYMEAPINKSEKLIWRDEEVALKCTFLQEPLLCFFVRVSASTQQRGCLHCGGPFSTFKRSRALPNKALKRPQKEGRKGGRPLARPAPRSLAHSLFARSKDGVAWPSE